MTFGRRGRAIVLVAACLGAGACTDDGGDADSTTTEETTSSTVAPDDPTLERLLLTAEDLPDGFAATEDAPETVTSFCAGQDAAAGLRADGRAIVFFARTPAGASVLEVVFRFEDDGAQTFVDQAEQLLTDCSEVPDASGLAFTYEPLSEPVAATLAEAEDAAGAFGTSVGAGNLTVEVAALKHDDLGALVAVLGSEEPRADLDALATSAFEAAIANLG